MIEIVAKVKGRRLFAELNTTREALYMILWVRLCQRNDLVCRTLGVPRSTVAEWLKGTRRLSARTTTVFAALLDIPEDLVNTPLEGEPLRPTRSDAKKGGV